MDVRTVYRVQGYYQQGMFVWVCNVCAREVIEFNGFLSGPGTFKTMSQ